MRASPRLFPLPSPPPPSHLSPSPPRPPPPIRPSAPPPTPRPPIQSQLGDKQEPNKIQECTRAIVAEIRAAERVLRKAARDGDAACGGAEPATDGPGAGAEAEAGVGAEAGAVAGTGTRAARALSRDVAR